MLKRIWHDWDLTMVLTALFLVALIAQSVSGLDVYNEEQLLNGERTVGYAAYLATPHFWEATTENWESEFLQMFTLVVLTVFLRQKGSPESDSPEDPPGYEKSPKHAHTPRLARRSPAWRRLYEHSLSLALIALFGAAFIGHVLSGAADYNEQRVAEGQRPLTVAAFIDHPQLWFQSTQNWQSEFMSSALLVVLTVYLREKGSSESKPVDESDDENGE